jgi:predicted site-specific integrase-resolvase
MVNALVLHRNTQLAKAQKALRAAQYVRMSTDLQRYSTQNQAAAIAAYAQQRNLTIVRTYVDEGRSGVRINRRPALAELIKDVQSGNTDFEHILVYDVSRWGRFQDVDESAHYEFVCKQGGAKVAYCAEQFENDGSLLVEHFKEHQARHGGRVHCRRTTPRPRPSRGRSDGKRPGPAMAPSGYFPPRARDEKTHLSPDRSALHREAK